MAVKQSCFGVTVTVMRPPLETSFQLPDDGKSTLADSLVSRAGLLATKLTGTARALDRDDLERAHGITIDSAVVALEYPGWEALLPPPTTADDEAVEAAAEELLLHGGDHSDTAADAIVEMPPEDGDGGSAPVPQQADDAASIAASARESAERAAWLSAELAARDAAFSALGRLSALDEAAEDEDERDAARLGVAASRTAPCRPPSLRPPAMHAVRLHVTGLPRVKQADPGSSTEEAAAAVSAALILGMRALCQREGADRILDAARSLELEESASVASSAAATASHAGAVPEALGALGWPSSAGQLASWLAGASVVASSAPPAAGLAMGAPASAAPRIAVRTRARSNARLESSHPGAAAALFALWSGLSALDSASAPPSVDEPLPPAPGGAPGPLDAPPARVTARLLHPLTLAWRAPGCRPKPLALELPRTSSRSQLGGICASLGWSLAWQVHAVELASAHGAAADDAERSDCASAKVGRGFRPRFVASVVLSRPRTGLITAHWPDDSASLAGAAALVCVPTAVRSTRSALAFSTLRAAKEAASRSALEDVRQHQLLLRAHAALPSSASRSGSAESSSASSAAAPTRYAQLVARAAAAAESARRLAEAEKHRAEALAAEAQAEAAKQAGATAAAAADPADAAPARDRAAASSLPACAAGTPPPEYPGLRVNLIDCPGHAEFGGEVAAALRASDGCLLVVDVVEGPRAQTESVLRQAIAARVRPVLVVNKADRLFAELRLSPRDAVRTRILPLVSRVNALIAAESARAGWMCPVLSFGDGSVVVSSGYMRWALSARSLACATGKRAAREALRAFFKARDASSTPGDAADAAAAAATAAREAERSTLDAFRRSPARALEKFGIEPVWKLAEAAAQCAAGDTDAAALLSKALRRAACVDTSLSALEACAAGARAMPTPAKPPAPGTPHKDAVRAVLSALFPVADCVMDACAAVLPSPAEAQPERVASLFGDEDESGWKEDDEAAMAAAACSTDQPLVAYATKLIDSFGSAGLGASAGGGSASGSSSDAFLAVVRLFSGALRVGDAVWCRDDSASAWTAATVRGVFRLSGGAGMKLVSCPEGAFAGDVVAVAGVAAGLVCRGTIAARPAAPASPAEPGLTALRPLPLPVEPIAAVSVRATPPSGRGRLNPAQVRRLRSAIASLTRTDPLARVGESSDHRPSAASSSSSFELQGAGELHLQVCLSRLEARSGLVLLASPPTKPHRETVAAGPTAPAVDASRVAMGRSSNGHVRVWITAEAMTEEGLQRILAADAALPCEPPAAVADAMAAVCGWKRDAAARVWAAGPAPAAGSVDRPTCLLIDATSSVPHLAGAKDSIIRAFFEATAAGPLAEQQLRGVVFRLVDAAVHAESMHRSAVQVVPAASRALRGSFLLAQPCILEPTVTLRVATPPEVIQPVFDFVAARGGEVEDVTERAGRTVVAAVLPALQAMALDDLAELTSGRATVSVQAGGWKPVRGDPLDAASVDGEAAAATALSGTASASAVEGWGRVVRFDPPSPDRTAADAVAALRAQMGLSGAPLTAAASADATGCVR